MPRIIPNKYDISPSVLFSQEIYEYLYTPCNCLVSLLEIEELVSLKRHHRGAFIVHLVLKIIPIAIFLTDTLYNKFFSTTVINELLLLFVVVEFWVTKNYTGRMLTGMWWGFEEVDGRERLKIEMRVNIEIVPTFHFKLFWLLQAAYFVVPILLIFTQMMTSSNLQIAILKNYRAILLNLIPLVGGSANLFIFFRGYLKMNENHYFLKYKLGSEYIKRLGNASMTNYL